MPEQLHNILVPVDFTGRNKWAINKAIELSNSFHCNIHLVYVLHKRLFPFLPFDRTSITPYESSRDLFIGRKKLEQLKATYKWQLPSDATIEISILEGNPHQQLSTYIRQQAMDMVIASRKFMKNAAVPIVLVNREKKSVNRKSMVDSQTPAQDFRLSTIDY